MQNRTSYDILLNEFANCLSEYMNTVRTRKEMNYAANCLVVVDRNSNTCSQKRSSYPQTSRLLMVIELNHFEINCQQEIATQNNDYTNENNSIFFIRNNSILLRAIYAPTREACHSKEV